MREWTLDDFDLAESAITVLLPTRKELANLIFGLIVGLALARKDPDTHGDADEAEGCDRIVNNGFGEPTECGRTLPCEHHSRGAE